MKRALYATLVLAMAAPTAPVFAMSATPTIDPQADQMRTVEPAAYTSAPYYPRHRHHTRYGGTVGDNGGYRVNRYGYGNYVAGPAGGFAGYPPGSAGAQVYHQQEEWKCEAVPESC